MQGDIRVAEEIVETCRKLVEYRLTYASLGNVSVKHSGHIYITPSGVRFDKITPEQIVKVDMKGRVIEGRKPSVELPMHLEIYRSITNASAIIHAHSIYSTTLGTLLGDLIFMNEEAEVFGLDIVPACMPAKHGTMELAKNVATVLKNRRATIIPNHGVVVYGENLDEAFQLLEILESLSKMKIMELMLRSRIVFATPPQFLF